MIRQRAVFLTPRLKSENSNMEQSLFEARAGRMKNHKLHKQMSNRKNKIVTRSNMTQATKNNLRHRNHLSTSKECENVPFIKLSTFTVTIIFASMLTKSDIIDSVRGEAQASLFSHPIYLPSSSTRMFASSPTSSILKRDLSARQELETNSMTIHKNLMRQVDGK